MPSIHVPTKEELQALEQRVLDSRFPADNVRFLGLYGVEDGLITREYPIYRRGPDGRLAKRVGRDGRTYLEVVGTRQLPLRRRQWIETCCMVRAKSGKLVRMKLKPAQRRLEAWILRMERAGVPVRIIILKARQMGFSTYIEAVVFEHTVRNRRSKSLVVAHDDETATEVLQITHTMRDEIPRRGQAWRFGMRHTATYHLAWGPPMYSQIKIASAKKKNPGRGFTVSVMHLSETAFWDDAAKKAQSLLNTLPRLQGTLAFMESTANGAVGYFYEMWRAARAEVGKPLNRRTVAWVPVFFPWYEDPDYRWSSTIGAGQELPEDMQLEILGTLQNEEHWLLQQKYLRRWRPDDAWERVPVTLSDGTIGEKWRRVGVGWQPVTLDQVAWRRTQIVELKGDPLRPETWNSFHEEFPATEQEAWLATGRAAFSSSLLLEAMQRAREPDFRGRLVTPDELDGDNRVNPNDMLDDYVNERRLNILDRHRDRN